MVLTRSQAKARGISRTKSESSETASLKTSQVRAAQYPLCYVRSFSLIKPYLQWTRLAIVLAIFAAFAGIVWLLWKTLLPPMEGIKMPPRYFPASVFWVLLLCSRNITVCLSLTGHWQTQKCLGGSLESTWIIVFRKWSSCICARKLLIFDTFLSFLFHRIH